MTNDPFERAVAREAELREDDAWKNDVVRNARVSNRQGLITFLLLIPFHFAWGGRTAATVTIHVVLIGLSALWALMFWADKKRRRRAPVYRRGKFNFIIRGTRRGEGW